MVPREDAPKPEVKAPVEPKPAPLAPATFAPPKPSEAPQTGPVPAPGPAPAPGVAPGPAPKPGEGLVLGAAYESAVIQLMDMGFPRDQVEKAMKAAFNNPERAADYLLTVTLFDVTII